MCARAWVKKRAEARRSLGVESWLALSRRRRANSPGSPRCADPAGYGASATVATADLQGEPLRVTTLGCPGRSVSVRADGQGRAGVPEPDGYHAVAGLGAAPSERLPLGRASRGVVVGPAVRLGRRRIGDCPVVVG